MAPSQLSKITLSHMDLNSNNHTHTNNNKDATTPTPTPTSSTPTTSSSSSSSSSSLLDPVLALVNHGIQLNLDLLGELSNHGINNNSKDVSLNDTDNTTTTASTTTTTTATMTTTATTESASGDAVDGKLKEWVRCLENMSRTAASLLLVNSCRPTNVLLPKDVLLAIERGDDVAAWANDQMESTIAQQQHVHGKTETIKEFKNMLEKALEKNES